MLTPPKAQPGDHVAILSPAFPAPAEGPEVHDQAMRRLQDQTGLVPVEYPTTRQLDASPEARAADVNAAFADPGIRGILATIGGDDQILVTPHLDPALPAADPKPFLGFSDNTNLLNWLWQRGVAAFHGGSTQLHLGAGPRVDDLHLRSLRAALLDGGELEITDPGESEDFGRHWDAPEALTEFGDRTSTEPWTWSGPSKSVTARTWGGCLEVLNQIALAGRLPSNDELEGVILLLETSEQLTPPEVVGEQLRAYGEHGLLGAVAGVAFARPIVSTFDVSPAEAEKTAMRAAQRDAVLEMVDAYNPDAVVCVGVPFGHTRPQWILPYGGEMTLDGAMQTVTARY